VKALPATGSWKGRAPSFRCPRQDNVPLTPNPH
jgi:hypothetical protein